MTDEFPVFLLDDVLSELDEKRKAYVLKEIFDCQVIITSCERIDPEVIKQAPDIKLIHAENGVFTTVEG